MSFEPSDYLRHILIEADFLLDRNRPLTLDTSRTDTTQPIQIVRTEAGRLALPPDGVLLLQLR